MANLEWYRQAFESASVGMCFADNKFHFIDVNPAFCAMLGYSREELLSKTIIEVTFPDDVSNTAEKLQKIFREGSGTFKIEKRYLTKTGEIVWGLTTVCVVERDNESRVVRTFAVVQDITSRKKLESSLKESETNYHTMIEMSPDAVAVHSDGKVTSIMGVSRDISAQKAAELELMTSNRRLKESEDRFRSLFTNMLDGFAHCQMLYDEKNVPVDFVYLDVNDRFTELTGLRNVVGKKVSEVIPGIKESNPELFEIYGRTAMTGEPSRLETHIPQLSIWLSISVYSPQKNHFVAVFSNITDRKKAEMGLAKASKDVEEALKITASEKAKLETVLNGIADGVFVIDDHGKIVLFNRAAEKISGFSFDIIKDKQYWGVLSFVPEGLSEAKVDFIRNALSGNDRELEVNLSLKKASGKVVPIRASAAILDGRDEQSLGIVVIFRDVSKEREIQQLRNEFMMIVSHELRAPMTAVKWLVSMMLGGSYGSVAENLKTPLTTIAAAVDRLIHLVNDMINITRVEAGNLRLTLTDFDIKKMVDDLIVTFGSEAKKKNVTIETGGVALAMVQGDSDWTAQVLSNLIDNAIKFNREGGTITILTTKENEYLKLAVTDTGIGIPDDFREKLFTKFAQVISKKAGKSIGTGLGLFISRELAREMGGNLELAATKIDTGSTFVITIPLSGSPAAGVMLVNHQKKAG